MIRCHCSKGYDHTIASFIKPVSEFLVSLINFIINNFIKINQTNGNSLESVQSQKYTYQWNLKLPTSIHFTSIIKDLRKSCFRANYQKETN